MIKKNSVSAGVLLVAFSFFCVSLYGLIYYNSVEIVNPYTYGYVKLEEIMRDCNYNEEDCLTWHKEESGVPIDVQYNINDCCCWKNDYYFPLTNPVITQKNEIYVRKDDLETILNIQIGLTNNGDYIVYDAKYIEWTDYKVIAHAGGGVKKDNNVYTYTNSKEALVQNYSLGTRVFEFDLFPTSDNNLAVVHDWDQFGDLNGRVYSTEEWLNHKTGGPNELSGDFTTMDIGALLDEMLINKDLFVITDTKSFALTDDEIRKEFEIIYREAKNRDEELLNRIVPQLYSFEMYDQVKSVFDFPNMIFTTYASEAAGSDIVSFCVKHQELKAITAPLLNYGRFGEIELLEMHDNNLKFYLHPVSTYDEVSLALNVGADGIYTGVYTERELEEWLSAQSSLITEGTK